ncbi:MAG: histidine kinase dimerization/phospho-acceptor domain-containing protein [Gordonibacter pamelaeae]
MDHEYLYFYPLGMRNGTCAPSCPTASSREISATLAAPSPQTPPSWAWPCCCSCCWCSLSTTREARRNTRLLAEEKDRAERAFAEAQQASLAKTEFLSRMSHEIRTPMNGIMGMTAIALESIGDDGKVRTCLEKVTLSSEHLLSLINDILDMSKIESGKVEIKKKPFDCPRSSGRWRPCSARRPPNATSPSPPWWRATCPAMWWAIRCGSTR